MSAIEEAASALRQLVRFDYRMDPGTQDRFMAHIDLLASAAAATDGKRQAGVTRASVATKHPETYFLANVQDMSVWRLTDTGWHRAGRLREPSFFEVEQ